MFNFNLINKKFFLKNNIENINLILNKIKLIIIPSSFIFFIIEIFLNINEITNTFMMYTNFEYYLILFLFFCIYFILFNIILNYENILNFKKIFSIQNLITKTIIFLFIFSYVISFNYNILYTYNYNKIMP